MYKFLKKHMCSICLMLILSAVFFLNPVEAKAGLTDMKLNTDGTIKWEAASQNSTSTGWKFYVKYWKFTITKTLNGKTTTKTVDVYQNNEGYSERVDSWWQGSTEYYNHYYSCSVSNLEALSGMYLREGTVKYEADAAIGFRYKKSDGTYSTTKVDNGTYDTKKEFYDRCEHYGFKSPAELYYKGYHDKEVQDTDKIFLSLPPAITVFLK